MYIIYTTRQLLYFAFGHHFQFHSNDDPRRILLVRWWLYVLLASSVVVARSDLIGGYCTFIAAQQTQENFVIFCDTWS